MKRLILFVAIFAVVIALAATAFYFAGGRIALFAATKMGNVDIAYAQMKNESVRQYDFTDFILNDKKTGIGLKAAKATVRPVWTDILTGKMSVDFRLTDVTFIKRESERPDDYQTFEGLAALPFSSERTYLDMSGFLQTSGGDIRAKDFKATSDLLKFTITGDLLHDASVNADITIYMSDSLFAKVPKHIIKGVLKEEGEGWKSFSMKLSGNYKAPSIQVSGNQFRLTVGEFPVRK